MTTLEACEQFREAVLDFIYEFGKAIKADIILDKLSTYLRRFNEF